MVQQLMLEEGLFKVKEDQESSGARHDSNLELKRYFRPEGAGSHLMPTKQPDADEAPG